MNRQLITTIKEKFKEKSNEELICIYQKNQRYDYSDEAFEAMKIILRERNLEIPKQELPIFEKTKKEKIKYSERYYKLKRNGYIGMIGGLVLIVFSTVFDKSITTGTSTSLLNPFYLLGVFLWFWGFHKYVLRKGYGGAYTLLGIFGVIGLLIMYHKEDLGEAKNEND